MAAGAREASYAEMGAECGVVITIVPTDAIGQDILFGEGGVASTIKKGALVCDMSSVTPVESKQCYDRLKAMGVGFLDAPLSGGEPGAVAGTLVIMCGGDEKDFETMKPWLDILRLQRAPDRAQRQHGEARQPDDRQQHHRRGL